METYWHWQTIAKEELRQDTADLLAMQCIMAFDSARLNKSSPYYNLPAHILSGSAVLDSCYN